ncbi:phage antirepressor KilAC domain-containing protein [Bacillus cereus group sp. N21]|uniref:phage antirepressor KilAC domain-containing protein n=1 Tax=Bacillus cereus group sp. N21 TaxID=2794591 RepID=UPI0018F5C4A3|nr:phage antirepressor KilAC domain-containing protein [Bacillus cereus group sp. N21]MBJ8027263.1 phage antirepressor KilAC domain-containing protein [Bacillus cereus group sp. N21]
MTNNLQVVHEQDVLGQDFKVYGTTEEPLFLAQDVAEWVGHSNTTVMLNVVDEDEKRLNIVYTSTGNKDAWFLTEDGLYEVLMQSRKPIAKAFRKEVKKVLKAIRQTGGYISNADLMVSTYFGALPQEQQTLVKGLFVNIEEQQKQLSQAQKVITEQAPKVEYADKILLAEGFYTTTEIAKVFGMSAQFLHSELKRKGIIYKTSKKNWVHNEKYKFLREQGLIKYEVNTFGMTMKWSEKGREWLAKEFSIVCA